MKNNLFLLLVLIFLLSCSVEPVPINYMEDACHFCKMNIVDKQHGAEIVTKKGKVFKYDAIECMLHDLSNIEENKIDLFLVNTYDQPVNLIDATHAIYLKSEAIPSPMGAFLTAFSTQKEALKIKDVDGGNVYDWSELNQLFLKQ